MLQPSCTDTDLNNIKTAIERETVLSQTVLDVQLDQDTLVVFTTVETPDTFVRLMLRQVWDGPIETYCATSLMAGADQA